MKKRDVILIVVLLLVSIAGLIPVFMRSSPQYAYIYVRGDLYGRYDLSDDTFIRIEDGRGLVNEIEISDNSIYMKSANCPNRICVKRGAISRDNEMICCAPAGILIVIGSDEGSEYDAITE